MFGLEKAVSKHPMDSRPQGISTVAPSAAAERGAGAGLWMSVFTLWQREIQGFYRQRSRVIGSLTTPLLFWFVLGSGFGSSLQTPHESYAQFFFPGAVALAVLFTSIFANISVIEDRREGFLLSVLAAPAPRLGLVLGKVLGATTIGALQGLLLLPPAPLAGVTLSPGAFPAVFAMVLATAFGLTAMGFYFAWRLDSVQGFHSIMNVVLMPMWLLSGGVFPVDGSSGWIRWVTAANPLTYGVTGLRRLLGAGVSEAAPPQAVCWAVVAGFGVAALALAWRQASRPGVGNPG